MTSGCFQKQYALKGKGFQDSEDIKKSDGTESYSTTGVPKMFPTVATLSDKFTDAQTKYFKGDPTLETVTHVLALKSFL
jgi:hypothetical protein